MSEEVLYFWLRIPPTGGGYKRSVDKMVDRAEIGVEYQKMYTQYCPHEQEPGVPVPDIPTDRFGLGLFDNMGGEPNLVWFKNFHEPDINSLRTHWHENTDTPFADSVDMTSWGGHCAGWRGMHFFEEDCSCVNLKLADTRLGNTDADWIIFDTCYSLATNGLDDISDLKDDLVSSVTGERCAHLFLGFYGYAHWNESDCGEYFAKRLKEVGIKEAWFDYCQNRQPVGSIVRVFGAEDSMDDSVAGTGPIEVSRDPTKDSEWTHDYYVKLSD